MVQLYEIAESRVCLHFMESFLPTSGGLAWHGSGAYGLRGSCRFHFLGIQRGRLPRVPQFGPSNLAYLRHSCRLWLFSCLRATPVVMGSLATVPSGDRFLSPVPNRRGSYERGSRSTHNCLLAGTFFQLKCIINLATWTQ